MRTARFVARASHFCSRRRSARGYAAAEIVGFSAPPNLHIQVTALRRSRGERPPIKHKCRLDRHVTSRHDTPSNPCIVAVSSLSNSTARHAPRRTCRVVSRHDATSQVEFGLNHFQHATVYSSGGLRGGGATALLSPWATDWRRHSRYS